ncbi:MAG: Ig-like domain-containing protein, partial [Planctomycetaceae bacterium]
NVTVGGGTLSDLSGAGAVYTATFTPNPSSTVSGTVSVAVGKIADLAGNVNTVAARLTPIKVDTLPPTVKVTSTPGSLKIAGTSKLTFILSEASTTFTADDVTVTGGTISGFAGTGAAYSATFMPTAGFEGEGTVSIAAGSFLDAAGNGNLAGDLATPIKIDTLAPTVLITSDLATLTAGQTTTIRVTLSEPSTTFKVTSLSVTNGTLSNFVAVSATSYTVTFTPKAAFKGTATVSVLAGKFTDALGNGNIASSLLSLSIT